MVNDLGGSIQGEGSDAGPATAVADEIAAAGGKAIADTSDVATAEGAAALVDAAVHQFGRLDILINNATNISQGSFFAMTEEHWDRAFDNKLRGTVRCIRHAVPPMRERKWGRIVNISGGAAWTPQLGAITTGINNAAWPAAWPPQAPTTASRST